MTEPCKLRARLGEHAHCDEETCVYWRAVESLDTDVTPAGCAIEYFQLIEGGEHLAEWLLSVKVRVEALDAPTEAP